MKKVTILCGKSASGKDSLAKKMVQMGFEPIVSYTTRPKREGEVDYVDYVFLNAKGFLEMEREDKFIETRSYRTLVGGKPATWYYGTRKQDYIFLDDKKYVMVADPIGAEKIRDFYGKKHCEIIYLEAPYSIRLERATRRGSFDLTEFERRAKADDIDFDRIGLLADKIVVNVNKTLDELVEEVLG